MKLKHLLLAGVAAGAANMAMAASTGTITFDGLIVAESCNVSVDGSGTVVKLPTVKVADFADGVNTKPVGPYDFNLNFTDCGAALAERGFTLTLTPVGYAGTGNNYLKNTDISSTGATNVGIQLGYGTIASSPINFNGTSDTPTTVHKTLSNGTLTIPFQAQYVPIDTSEAVGPGKVVSSLDWTINYQ